MVENISKGEVMFATVNEIPDWMKLVDIVIDNFPGKCMGEYGITGKCYFVKRKDGDISTNHVHCFTKGHENLINQLLFRDYLNAHPEAVREYNELKLSLLEKYSKERHKYTESKTDFIMKIIQLAQKDRSKHV